MQAKEARKVVKVDQRTNSIEMTRGDTLRVHFKAMSGDEEYQYKDGDSLWFYARPKTDKDNTKMPTIKKEIPTATGELHLDPEDTKKITTDNLVYDIELTKANGDVDTIINRAELKLVPEVY